MITIKMTGNLKGHGWIRTVVKGEGDELTEYANVIVNGVVEPMKEMWNDFKAMAEEEKKNNNN